MMKMDPSQYSEKVMEHFANPRNIGEIPDADGIGNVGNPICGDVLRLYIKVKDGVIVDTKFKTFGCLPSGIEVVSNKGGWDEISSVRKGDYAVNSDGESARVVETYKRRYNGQLLDVTPFVSPYNSFSVTPGHPVLCIRRKALKKSRRSGNKCTWLRANEKELRKTTPDYINAHLLDKGDYLVFAVNKEVQDNPSLTYDAVRLLGYYAAEGYIIAKGNAVAFAFNKNEKCIIADAKKLILRIAGKEAKSRTRDNVCEVYVCSKKLAGFLKKHAGSLARHKAFSQDVMYLPYDKQLELVKTYLIGDGNFYKRRPSSNFTFRCSTVSRNLAIQLQEMLARNKIFASMKQIHKKATKIGSRTIKASTMYQLSFQLERSHKFVHALDRGRFLVPIRHVKKRFYRGNVYNFQVHTTPNSYLVKGFAVHNCGAAIATSSMVTELVKGKTVEDALKISNSAVAEALGGLPPIKMHCSLLAEQALKSALKDYYERR